MSAAELLEQLIRCEDIDDVCSGTASAAAVAAAALRALLLLAGPHSP